ncbi:Glycoside hydrolase [Vigna unguiculata]|uniref:Glycoside hydrolase n=1 Tax=Vigna unguiculata TaxID=3917 RepID=A0A4D6KUB0_VIGUN|nr:Glycoside hydrolase [Vigna unguiculata]
MDVEVEVFISIGNHDNRHPFKSLNREAWIVNTTDSLTRLLQEVNLQVDSIDVQYEEIAPPGFSPSSTFHFSHPFQQTLKWRCSEPATAANQRRQRTRAAANSEPVTVEG